MNIEYIRQKLLKKNLLLPITTIAAVIEEYEKILSEERFADQFGGEIEDTPDERDSLDEDFPGQYSGR